MVQDPIVEEVRTVRRKLFQHCHNNLDELIALVQRDAPGVRRRARSPTFRFRSRKEDRRPGRR